MGNKSVLKKLRPPKRQTLSEAEYATGELFCGKWDEVPTLFWCRYPDNTIAGTGIEHKRACCLIGQAHSMDDIEGAAESIADGERLAPTATPARKWHNRRRHK